jgi:hypothetical protein
MPVNFLTDSQEERSTLRPADYGVWVSRREACMCYLTRVSRQVGLRT